MAGALWPGSGANLAAALQLGREAASRGETASIVTIFCDGADKYLSDHFWDEE